MSNENIVIDLTNYRERIGQRVDPGTYRVLVEDAEMDTSKSGNSMVNLWFKIQGGDFDGATLTDRLVLTEKSLFRVVGFMNAIGLPTPKKRLAVKLSQFKNKVLDVTVEDGQPYQGRIRSEIRGYARVPKSQQTASAGAGAADLEDIEDTSEEQIANPVEAATETETRPAEQTGSAEPAAESTQPSSSAETDEVDLDDISDL